MTAKICFVNLYRVLQEEITNGIESTSKTTAEFLGNPFTLYLNIFDIKGVLAAVNGEYLQHED